MSKIALTDIETTGLRPSYHEIVEIACIVFDEDDPGSGLTFERKVWPQFPERMDPKAQKVNGYSAEEWRKAGAIPLERALREYAVFTKDALFMAYNVGFDAGFLEAAAFRTNVKLELKRPNLCLLTLAYAYVKARQEGKPRTWRMADVCKHFGLPPEPEVHRALNGVMAEFGLYQFFLK